MPSIGYPLWLLAPLIGLAAMSWGHYRRTLPGTWPRAIDDGLQAYLAESVISAPAPWRRLAYMVLWILMSAAIATISLSPIETPKLRNLEARIVVIDLGVPEIADERIAAARFLIDSSNDVPTAVVAVTEHAFDVVPLTRDTTYLDRYLEVLTKDVMPVQGRSLLTGIERAMALLDRADIQARQITVFSGGNPPQIGRFQMPNRDQRENIWLVIPHDEAGAWQTFASAMDAMVVNDRDTSAISADFEERRREATAKSVSSRERHDLTPWLILMLMPFWLLLFFRRQPD